MKFPNIFSKIYATVLIGSIGIGSWLLGQQQYQQWGIGILLFVVLLLVGYPRVVNQKKSDQKEEHGVLKISTFGANQDNPELMPWSGLVIPWCGSLFISIVMNIFLMELISANMLIGMELLISMVLTAGVLHRSSTVLFKYGREGAFGLFLVPMSSVVVALILSAWWPVGG